MERILKTKQKILHSKKRLTSLACLLMAAALFVSLQPIKTNALSINGAGSGVVTGSGTETGDYGYRSAEGLLGFRVTLVDSLGNTASSKATYDIYSSSLNTKTLVRFTIKYSKAELISLYEKLDFPLTTTSSSTVYDDYTVSVSDWGLTLPSSAADMVNWAGNDNIKTLLEKAWNTNPDDLAKYGWAIMMEPIYEVKIKNTYFALTPTEIAIVAVADGSSYRYPTNYWDDIPDAESSASSWKYVSTYTHGAWPQALTLTEAQAGIAAPSKTLTKTSRGTSRQIIEEGYGVMLVYSKNLSKTYTVTYNGNGGLYDGSETWVDTIRSPVAMGQDYTTWSNDNFFVRPGYTFIGWKDQNGTDWTGDINKPWTWSYNYDVTLYAQWEPIEYTVTYDGNGGYWGKQSTWADPNKVTIGEAYTVYSNDNFFENPGYEFVGWKDQNGEDWTIHITQPFVWKAPYTYDITLYAQWKPITYTVKYDGNGGDGTMADQTFAYDEEQTLTANAFTRAGHMFTGWATSEDGEKVYEDQQAVINLTATDETVIVLYAVWNDGSDEGPEITAADRWFTLKDAQNNVITLEELMSTATAEDSSVGDVTDFSEKKDNFTIIDYSEEDFRKFDKAGSVTVTYWAKDKAGNVAHKTITVHIVDNETSASTGAGNNSVEKHKIRFISNRYYLDDTGAFVGASNGGFNDYSKWVTESSYVTLLTNTLVNSYNDGVWGVAPAYSFTLDSDELDSMKSFVNTKGVGESLDDFYNDFLTGAH